MADLPTKCHLCGSDAVAVFYFSQGCHCDTTTVQPLCLHHAYKSGSTTGTMELIKDLTDGEFAKVWKENMGVYSTMDITRNDAYEAIKAALEDISKVTDQQLEDIMFDLYGKNMMNNFRIIDYYIGANWTKEWGYKDEPNT